MTKIHSRLTSILEVSCSSTPTLNPSPKDYSLTNSCQSAATSKNVKALVVTCLTHVSTAIASTGPLVHLPLVPLTFSQVSKFVHYDRKMLRKPQNISQWSLMLFVSKTNRLPRRWQQHWHQALTAQAPQLAAVAMLHRHWYQLPAQPTAWHQLILTYLLASSTATIHSFVFIHYHVFIHSLQEHKQCIEQYIETKQIIVFYGSEKPKWHLQLPT